MNFDTPSSRSAKIADPLSETSAAEEVGFRKKDHANCSAVLFDNLKRNPDNIAITGPLGTLTYKALCEEASRWGNALANSGLQRGSRVALFLDDTPAYPAVFFGAVRAGFVPVLLNTQTTPDLLAFLLADTSAEIAVCEAEFAPEFTAEIIEKTAIKTIVIANGSGAVNSARFIHADDFVKDHSTTLKCADTSPDDMAFWMYSSGSTGRPKGIVHLQHDMAYTAASYAKRILDLKPEDRCFSVPKIFFAYGFGNAFTFPFTVGASTVLMPGRPEPDRVLDMIESFRPTTFFGLPTLYTALCRSDGVESRDLSSLRLTISAAETLSEDIFSAWKSLSGLEAVEGLGSTEMLHIYISNRVDDKRLGSAGRAVPGYDVILRDKDGKETATGEEGVMWVRGDSSAPCYWNRPEKTAETMVGDWICTGDRFVERDGFYYFQGRADDLIKVSGQWVWPLEVERCLAEHPNVHECAVIAHQLADKRMTLRAIVRLRDGVTPGKAETRSLQDHVRQALLPFKYPRIVDYVEDLPKTGTGKIDRQKLSALPTSDLAGA